MPETLTHHSADDLRRVISAAYRRAGIDDVADATRWPEMRVVLRDNQQARAAFLELAAREGRRS